MIFEINTKTIFVKTRIKTTPSIPLCAQQDTCMYMVAEWYYQLSACRVFTVLALSAAKHSMDTQQAISGYAHGAIREICGVVY